VLDLGFRLGPRTVGLLAAAHPRDVAGFDLFDTITCAFYLSSPKLRDNQTVVPLLLSLLMGDQLLEVGHSRANAVPTILRAQRLFDNPLIGIQSHLADKLPGRGISFVVPDCASSQQLHRLEAVRGIFDVNE